ncbi:MAG: hypothetical protein WBM02_00865 [bacterium]
MKLLDYGEPYPFGEILGKASTLVWPVNVFRVTLPKISENSKELNPFERVVLKLIDAGAVRDEKFLVQETCLPVDLVKFVLLRLQDKGFINEYHEIIEQQRNDWEHQDAKPSHYVTALLFRELAGGKILPFLHLDSPLKTKKTSIGPYKKILEDKSHRKTQPSVRDVILALRIMQKRSRDFGNETRLPAVKHISIAADPERYHLVCPIAIQKNDGEFRIADPFGTGFSLVLEQVFNQLLEKDNDLKEWLMQWKNSLSRSIQDKPETRLKELYNTERNRGRYPNLVANLRLENYASYRSITQIYAALEWALFYSCAQRSYENAINQLKFTNQSEHHTLLAKAARNIGFDLPKFKFQSIWAGKIEAFLNGAAEMVTVLSIALLMAKDDSSHPLHRIAIKYSDFIIWIFQIKQKRDPQAHGSEKIDSVEHKLPEEAFMREIVSILIPSIQLTPSTVPSSDKDLIADALFDARTSIQNEFGFRVFNRLGRNLQDRLIHAERFWLSCQDNHDAQTFACDVYAATQNALRHSLSGALPPDVKDSEFVTRAQESAAKYGLGELPASLCNIKQIAIRKTLQGESQTLGASVIAYLLMSDENTLLSIASIQPSFLTDIELIITRRGHGNQPLFLLKEDINKLRKAALSTIKTLREV